MEENKRWHRGSSDAIRNQLVAWLETKAQNPNLLEARSFLVLIALRFRRFVDAADFDVPPDHMHSVDVALVTDASIVQDVAASRRERPNPRSRIDVVLGAVRLAVPLGTMMRFRDADRRNTPMLLEVIITGGAGSDSKTLLFVPIESPDITVLTSYDVLRSLPAEREIMLTPASVLNAIPEAVARERIWPARPKALFLNDMIAYEVALVCDSPTSPCEAVANYHLIRVSKPLTDSTLIGYEELSEATPYPDAGAAKASVTFSLSGTPVGRLQILKDGRAKAIDDPDAAPGAQQNVQYPVANLRASGPLWRQEERYTLETRVWFSGASKFNSEFADAVNTFALLRQGRWVDDESAVMKESDRILMSMPAAYNALPFAVRAQYINTVCGRTSYAMFTADTTTTKFIVRVWRPLMVFSGAGGGYNVLAGVKSPDEMESDVGPEYDAMSALDGTHPLQLRQIAGAAKLIWSTQGKWTKT